jgi:hypothetical protein
MTRTFWIGLWGFTWAQYNLYYDLRAFNLGFSMGTNYSQLKIQYK